MKRLSTYLLAGVAVFSASCADFLDTAPKDALSPATTWKTETDAESFVVGCYNGLLNPSSFTWIADLISVTITSRGRDGVLGETGLWQVEIRVILSMILLSSDVVILYWITLTMWNLLLQERKNN